MKQRIIVLSSNPYSMNDNGRTTQGVSIRYLTVDNLDPVVNPDLESKGTRPAKDNLPYSWKDLFVAVPGFYDADLGIKVGADGKPVLGISSIEYCGNVKVSLDAKGKDSIPVK